MKCRHCLVEFFPQIQKDEIRNQYDPDGIWVIEYCKCPSCNHLNIDLVLCNVYLDAHKSEYLRDEISRRGINPLGTSRNPCPAEVPDEIAEDCKEACLVLQHSPKASAALTRRCLQNLLRDHAGVKHSDLSNEIQQLLDSGKLPSHLAEIIDAVRAVGNFAAHPIKSKSTGEIVPVEPAEAELNLEVLEGLFDFYFVLPAKTAARKAEINAKLADAGKPALK